MAKSGTLEVKIVGDTAPVEKSMKSAGGKAGDFAKKLAKVGAVGAAAAAAGLGKLVTSTANYGDRVAKTSRQVGLGVEAFQEYEFALGQMGLSQTESTKALEKLNIRIGRAADGQTTYKEAVEATGTKLRDANGDMRDQDAIFSDVIGGLGEMESSQQRAAVAADLFGTSVGPKLATAIESGNGSIDELRQKAQDLGIVMDSDAAEASERFNDRLDDLKQGIQGAGREIGSQLIPVLADEVVPAINDEVIPAIQEFADWVGPRLEAKLEQAMEIIEDLWPVAKDTFENLLDITEDVGKVIGELVSAFASLNDATDGNAGKVAAWTATAVIATTQVRKLTGKMGLLGKGRMGGALGGVTLALGAGVVAWQQWNDQQERADRVARETKAAIVELESVTEGLNESITSTLQSNDEFRESFVRAGGDVDTLAEKLQAGGDEWETYRDELISNEAEAGNTFEAMFILRGGLEQLAKGVDEGSTVLDEMREAGLKTGDAAKNVVKPQLEDMGQGASGTAGEVRSLRDRLNEVIDEAFKMPGARRAVVESLAEVDSALEESGGSLDIFSEKGRAAESALEDATSDILSWIAGLEKEGATEEEMREARDFSRNALSNLAQEYGVAEDKLRPYLDLLNEIPSEVTTTVVTEHVSRGHPTGFTPPVGQSAPSHIAGAQHGGVVTKSGLAEVHKGEVFSGVDRDFGPFGQKPEITINVSSTANPREIADEVGWILRTRGVPA